MEENKKLNKVNEVEIDIRFKISALWVAVLFIFAYVDIFGLYKPGIINEIIAGKITTLQISQTFLFFTTLYVVIPSLMIPASLILRPKINRWTNVIVSVFYILTIVSSCIGETWSFYIFGSVVESSLLLFIILYSWKWPRNEI